MAEKSFRDREGRGELLRLECMNFNPVFTPADVSLGTAQFQVFLGTINGLNTSVETLEGTYSTHAVSRQTLVRTVKGRVTQTLARLKSNTAWKSPYEAAKKVADKLRGKRPQAPKPPGPGEPPPTVKKRNSGEQAYVEIAALLEKFVLIATGAAGYATGVPPEIAPSALNALLSSLRGENAFLAQTGAQLTCKQQDRLEAYVGPGGFQEKFLAIKEAVKSQYGATSAEYGAVKGIKW